MLTKKSLNLSTIVFGSDISNSPSINVFGRTLVLSYAVVAANVVFGRVDDG